MDEWGQMVRQAVGGRGSAREVEERIGGMQRGGEEWGGAEGEGGGVGETEGEGEEEGGEREILQPFNQKFN